MRERGASPTYLGGVWDRTGAGAASTRASPPRACCEAALRLGVRVHEHTPRRSRARTPRCRATAGAAACAPVASLLATSA